FVMVAISLITVTLFFFFRKIEANFRATPAVQHLSPRAEYQGGWPLALTGTASGSCPADASVSCSRNTINPSCCPSDQTCIFGYSQDANYCCPTSADCNTAVLNFPRCANTTWTMFKNYPAGFFCCEPGLIGVSPAVGLAGGICEPADQVVPTSLLATIIPQATVAASSKPANQTEAGGPTITNPVSSPTSSSSSDTGIASWPMKTKIGLGIAVGVAVLIVLVLAGVCSRRRSARVAYNGYAAQYDEYGNLVPAYNAGYEPYRRPDRNSEGNNVTVNVVQGDLQH
ncbi:hypothetical protein LSUE1_G002959, partial [Lachnellula suecica]